MITSQRAAGNGHTYSGVPNDVPAEDTPSSKNISWNLVQYDHVRENAILDDIVSVLENKSTTRPATEPTTGPSSTKPAGR
jgi:hypothetical protein